MAYHVARWNAAVFHSLLDSFILVCCLAVNVARMSDFGFKAAVETVNFLHQLVEFILLSLHEVHYLANLLDLLANCFRLEGLLVGIPLGIDIMPHGGAGLLLLESIA